MSTVLIFGEPWDAPICDDAQRYPDVPTYADCLRCEETFQPGDSGVLMPYVENGLDARFIVGVTASAALVGEHRECFLSEVAGHTVKVCGCTGWDPFARATALEVQRRFDAGALRT